MNVSNLVYRLLPGTKEEWGDETKRRKLLNRRWLMEYWIIMGTTGLMGVIIGLLTIWALLSI
jgi:hypothetical protein